jgi:hypothetical protein
MNQHDFVKECQKWYLDADLQPGNPEDGEWHECHYPAPKCLGGTETVLLLKEHHAIQGVLQSEEYDHPCVYGWEKEYCTGAYAPLYKKWKHLQVLLTHASRDPDAHANRAREALKNLTPEQRQQAHENSHKTCKELKVGIWSEGAGEKGRKSRWERDRIPIILVHPDGTEEWWGSATEACVKHDLSVQNLNHVLKRKRKRHKGYTARYANESLT